MPYMVTFTINIPQMLAYIPAPWILWVWNQCHSYGPVLDLSGNDSHLMADQAHPRLAKDSRSICGTRAILNFSICHLLTVATWVT